MKCGKSRIFGKGDLTDRLFDSGRRTLTRELNVLRIVRNLRIVEKHIELNMKDDDFDSLKADTRRIPIEPLGVEYSPSEAEPKGPDATPTIVEEEEYYIQQ